MPTGHENQRNLITLTLLLELVGADRTLSDPEKHLLEESISQALQGQRDNVGLSPDPLADGEVGSVEKHLATVVHQQLVGTPDAYAMAEKTYSLAELLDIHDQQCFSLLTGGFELTVTHLLSGQVWLYRKVEGERWRFAQAWKNDHTPTPPGKILHLIQLMLLEEIGSNLFNLPGGIPDTATCCTITRRLIFIFGRFHEKHFAGQ